VAELIALRTTVRAVTSRAGVRVDKWLGDGVMLVGVDSEPLVEAVVTISSRHARRGRLSLRAGIAGGLVILLEGDDYVGNAVNLAARLSDRAGPDEILAAEEGLGLPHSVLHGPTAEIAVPGFALPVPVVALSIRPRGRRVLPLTRLIPGGGHQPEEPGLPTPALDRSEREAGA
jgi:class 3 adenylate cyclase